MTIHRPACIRERRELPAFVVEFHEPDCPCIVCEQGRIDDDIAAAAAAAARAAIAPGTPLLDEFCFAGWCCFVGLVIGTAIAFAISPHGAWLALATMFGGGR